MSLSNKRILIYYSSNKLSVDLLSLMIGLKSVGYDVSFLTSCPKGILHEKLENKGIKTNSIMYKKNILFFIKHILYLSRYTQKNKIDIVYSHIQVNNFIASIAQFFSKSTFYMCRHHSDYVWKGNIKKAKIMDRIINKLSKHVVAISDKVYSQLIDVEKVNKKKIIRINLGYDFDLYPKVDTLKVKTLKKKYKTDFLLLNIGRLIPLKRQGMLIESCNILKNEGYEFKLIILGEGTERNKLKTLIKEYQLEKYVFFEGYVTNPLDFISASDIVIHPSESEASSTIGKEAALTKTPIMACQEVGDFEDYLDNSLGYLINKKITKDKLASEIMNIYAQKNKLYQKGILFHDKIINKFDINNILKEYIKAFK